MLNLFCAFLLALPGLKYDPPTVAAYGATMPSGNAYKTNLDLVRALRGLAANVA